MASGLWRTKSIEQSIKDTDEPGHKLKRTLSALAVLSCLWLMINLTAFTWLRFFGWMLIGIAVYFAYGRSHSILGRREGCAHGLAGGDPGDLRSATRRRRTGRFQSKERWLVAGRCPEP